MNLSNTTLSVLVMALVTYIIRVTPIVLVQGKLKSKFLQSFLYYMPYAVLGAMTFPSILYSSGNIFASTVGFGVALVLAYYDQGLMKVALGAILAVFICQILF